MAQCRRWQELYKLVAKETRRNKRFQYTHSLGLRYKRFCSSNRLVAYPASGQSVASFICSYVFNLKGSTKSVGNVVSSIKIYGLNRGHPWLGESDLHQLQLVRKQLSFMDTTPIKRKKAFTLDIILLIVHTLDLYQPEHFLWALCMLLAHNGLLRSGELFSGLKVSNISWDFTDQCFTIELTRSKVNRANGPEYIRIQDYEGVSAYKLLYKWFDTYHLWNKPDLYIIPFIGRRSGHNRRVVFDFHRNGSIQWWRKRSIPKLVGKVGLNASEYSGHSFRAGGATDLFTARVPYPIIKKYGRWKSDAALKYYRDELDVSNSVANAFSRAANNDRNDLHVSMNGGVIWYDTLRS